jgi:hypothetical protein
LQPTISRTVANVRSLFGEHPSQTSLKSNSLLAEKIQRFELPETVINFGGDAGEVLVLASVDVPPMFDIHKLWASSTLKIREQFIKDNEDKDRVPTLLQSYFNIVACRASKHRPNSLKGKKDKFVKIELFEKSKESQQS